MCKNANSRNAKPCFFSFFRKGPFLKTQVKTVRKSSFLTFLQKVKKVNFWVFEKSENHVKLFCKKSREFLQFFSVFSVFAIFENSEIFWNFWSEFQNLDNFISKDLEIPGFGAWKWPKFPWISLFALLKSPKKCPKFLEFSWVNWCNAKNFPPRQSNRVFCEICKNALFWKKRKIFGARGKKYFRIFAKNIFPFFTFSTFCIFAHFWFFRTVLTWVFKICPFLQKLKFTLFSRDFLSLKIPKISWVFLSELEQPEKFPANVK